jgi:hypothetical protein
MKNLTAAALLLGGVAPHSAAQAYDFTKVTWPERIAVGVIQGGQLRPLSVEATKAGWVTINSLPFRPDFGAAPPPPFRMMAGAAEIREWVQHLRPVLMSLVDTNIKVDPPTRAKVEEHPVTLGTGRYQIEVYLRNRQRPLLSWRACGSGESTLGPSVRDLLEFIALLDTAASIAGGKPGPPPTLSRPYYSIEVSCPAVADRANPFPLPPPGMGGALPMGDVATEFIVDTSGFVEPNSIRLLPSLNVTLGDSVRAAVAHWHFVPAEIAGARVRQIVQMGVPIGTRPTPSPAGARQLTVEATSDGWVHVEGLDPWHGGYVREWYEPDSVDAFVPRVQALYRQRDTLMRDTVVAPHRAVLVAPGREPLTARFVRLAGNVEMEGDLSDCTGMDIPFAIGDLTRFTAAARQARVNRPSPADPRESVHERSDATCPVWDPWTRAPREEIRVVENYPVGAYPESMKPSNARAEVLASFVVDTTGDVEMNTLEVMPGSDPRAAAAVPTTLLVRRFRPARRSGVKVPQRVIEAIRFEPPPVCATPVSGPACPRRYIQR